MNTNKYNIIIKEISNSQTCFGDASPSSVTNYDCKMKTIIINRERILR